MTSPRFSSSPRINKLFPSSSSILGPILFFGIGYLFGHWHGNDWDNNNNHQDNYSFLSSLYSSSSSSIHPCPMQQHCITTTTTTAIPLPSKDGWKQIDVFYGKQLPPPSISSSSVLDYNSTWYSQAQQDELVIGLLRGKSNGYFIDLAANDAIQLSNTYALEQQYQWDGLCIEPNPMYWKNLTSYRSCSIVAAVVGNRTRMLPMYFRYNAGDHGGIADTGFDNGKRWQRSSDIVYTVPLLEIFQRYNVPKDIDYLSLDVEGAESFILNQFPLSEYRIKIITAERLKGTVRLYLKQHGYEFVQRLTRWGESLWIHSSIRNELDWSIMERMQFPITN